MFGPDDALVSHIPQLRLALQFYSSQNPFEAYDTA